MFDDLIADLELLSTGDVRSATLLEIDELCKNRVFQLLCEICDVLHPRKARKS